MTTADTPEAREARRAARAHWSGRVARDGTQVELDTSPLTPEERVLAVWTATRSVWAFTGKPLPRRPRDQWPGVVRRSS